MKEYVKVIKDEKTISICLYIDYEKPLSVGEKLQQISEDAYMNGYNWEALLNYYLEQNEPELLDGLDSDPEADMYAAYYATSSENEEKAEKFVKIICELIEDEDMICAFVRDEGENIEWD